MHRDLLALIALSIVGCQVRPIVIDFVRIDAGTGAPIKDVVESFGSPTFISSKVKSQPGFAGLTANVQAFVDADGKIVGMRIYNSSGNTQYDRLAMEYMQSWTFKKREVCRPRPCDVAVPILLESYK